MRCHSDLAIRRFRCERAASSLSRLMISPTRFRRTPSLVRTPLYSETMASVTSQVKIPSSSQSRRSEALGFSTVRWDLNPATPATSTDVSMTPLGCFPRRPNRNLRQFLLLGPEAPNRLLDLRLRHTRQLLRRRLQIACELTLPSWPLSSPRQVLIHGGPRKLLV